MPSGGLYGKGHAPAGLSPGFTGGLPLRTYSTMVMGFWVPLHDCPPSGQAAGAHYPLAVGAGGCGRGDPSPTPQRGLLRAGFARCGDRTRAPGGGASCLGVGRPGSGALPPPTVRPLGGLPGPTADWLWVRGGAGVGTRHQPQGPRSCELALRAVRAARGRPGGAPYAWVWGVRVGALSHPRLPPLWAGCRGPLPTGCGCGGVRAWGPVTNPTAHALACCGGGMRVPGGGASCLGVGRLGSGALPPPTARPLGGLPGPTTHWLWVRGGAGVGTRHQPHSARSCELALRAVGAARGHPGGGAPPAWVWGVRGRALSHSNCPPSGRAAGAHYPLAVGAGGCGRGDPSPTPQRALLRAGFARFGGGTREPGGGGASCLGVRRPGSGALPPPTARPLGGLQGTTTHWLWVRGRAGGGTRHQPHSARSRELALRAVGAPRGRPGGAPPAWVWGVRGRALSHPQLPALWAGCRGPLPTGCGCGGVRAWGPVTNPTARALACCGGGMRVPGGAPLAWVWGVRGRALSQPRMPALWAGCRGPLPTGCGCGGVRAWGPFTNPTACALASWLCALWGRHEGARGGRLLTGSGASGVGRSPTPDCPPSGRAAGAHYPLAVGAGGCGRGDPSSTPQRALSRTVGVT